MSDDPAPMSESTARVIFWVVIVAGILAAALFEEWVAIKAQNHPWRVGIVGGIALVPTGLVLLLFPQRRLMALAAVVFGAWGIGMVSGLDARDHELGDYCRYGAASQAELDACMKRVDTHEIEELDTPAARFARGETNVCGPSSGRYCAEVARDRG
jgi:hypothetical protein